jgi:hypothetical protein
MLGRIPVLVCFILTTISVVSLFNATWVSSQVPLSTMIPFAPCRIGSEATGRLLLHATLGLSVLSPSQPQPLREMGGKTSVQ